MGILIDDGVRELVTRPGEGHLLGSGATVPADGEKGWAHGAWFFKTTGTGATDGAYMNVGSQTSANFDPADVTALQSALSSTSLKSFPITIDKWRVWDAIQTNAVGTAANDDLAVGGVFGTDSPSLDSGAVTNATATRLTACHIPVPANYVAGQPVTITVTVQEVDAAQVAATVIVSAHLVSNPSGTDLYAGAAVTMVGAATPTDKDFSLTATAIAPGDSIFLRVGMTLNDTGGTGSQYIATAVTAKFTVKQWA